MMKTLKYIAVLGLAVSTYAGASEDGEDEGAEPSGGGSKIGMHEILTLRLPADASSHDPADTKPVFGNGGEFTRQYNTEKGKLSIRFTYNPDGNSSVDTPNFLEVEQMGGVAKDLEIRIKRTLLTGTQFDPKALSERETELAVEDSILSELVTDATAELRKINPALVQLEGCGAFPLSKLVGHYEKKGQLLKDKLALQKETMNLILSMNAEMRIPYAVHGFGGIKKSPYYKDKGKEKGDVVAQFVAAQLKKGIVCFEFKNEVLPLTPEEIKQNRLLTNFVDFDWNLERLLNSFFLNLAEYLGGTVEASGDLIGVPRPSNYS